MNKPMFQILGISVALLFVTACGRGFDAAKTPGDKKVGQEAPSPVPAIPEIPAEELKKEEAAAEAAIEENNKKPAAEKLVFVTDNNDQKAFKAISALKVGTNLNISLITQSSETDPELLVNIDVPIVDLEDGKQYLSTSEMVDVKASKGDLSNVDELKKQFSVVYTCTEKCGKVSVRVQRALIVEEVEGKTIASGNAAQFEFEFPRINKEGKEVKADEEGEETAGGRLVRSSIKNGLPTVMDYQTSQAIAELAKETNATLAAESEKIAAEADATMAQRLKEQQAQATANAADRQPRATITIEALEPIEESNQD